MAEKGREDIERTILKGIVFTSGAKKEGGSSKPGVKTKAKKKAYITGAHGSASAKKKADIRRRRANRSKK